MSMLDWERDRLVSPDVATANCHEKKLRWFATKPDLRALNSVTLNLSFRDPRSGNNNSRYRILWQADLEGAVRYYEARYRI
jgi:hypothetical protein